ncbi:MAG: hypothetical protein ACRCX2_18000 [Paraclostridium sp.]
MSRKRSKREFLEMAKNIMSCKMVETERVEALACIQGALTNRFKGEESILRCYWIRKGYDISIVNFENNNMVMQDRYEFLGSLSKRQLKVELLRLEKEIDSINNLLSLDIRALVSTVKDDCGSFGDIFEKEEYLKRQVSNIRLYLLD